MHSNYLSALRAVMSGVSRRQAAKAHGISRDTIAILVRYAESKGWTDPDALEKITPQDLEPAMARRPGVGANRDQGYVMPDYEWVHQELGKAHVTLVMLWEEYVEDCIANNKQYYGETQFRRYYHQYAKKKKATIRLDHKPGLAMQVDWAGSKIGYYDEEFGELREASLFVAVLPCSQLIYADAFRDEKLPSWIKGHIEAFSYFSGVPKTIIPDNLKTGVTKAQFYEPGINRSYQELASYYGTVILPTRVQKPKDKGAVENSVKIASRRILGKLRNKEFHSLYELRASVSECLEAINRAPLTGRSMSRWDAFLEEEKDYLLTLPKAPFELSEWKKAKVQPDCHIAFQGHFYSVPFEHLGEEVEVRATMSTVEIFYHHQRVASHVRLHGDKKRHQTVVDHMPPNKLFFVNWDAERFIHWGRQTGPACAKIIEQILGRAVIEQHAYRACFGVLSLKDKYGEKRLERACQILLSRSKAPSYSQVKRILEKGEDLKGEENKESAEHRPHGFRRGSEYYGGAAKREGE
jgi:transposase